jgi:hypothetical protein
MLEQLHILQMEKLRLQEDTYFPRVTASMEVKMRIERYQIGRSIHNIMPSGREGVHRAGYLLRYGRCTPEFCSLFCF